jgi:L-lactate dehydrogenase complex protein LldF
VSDHLSGSTFDERSREQLAKPFQRGAIPAAVDSTQAHYRRIFAEADRDALRNLGRDIRLHAVANLPALVEQLVDRLEANGVTVHYAGDAAEACAITAAICTAAGARTVVKSKSMLSEEIELNPALEEAGLDVVETDLGEYVVQLDHDRPSHIIGPIIHKTAGEVRELFSRVAGRELSEDAAELTAFAREQLRATFLGADVGISGANFAVAETGTIALVTNEGNGRLTTSLPSTHIALVGVERIVPRLADLGVLVPLLCGSGTGQRITTYLTLAHGPRRAGEPDGPEAMHVVLVDGGRSSILGTDYQSILSCIRCGACQNVCPVYRQVGGHAYGWVYGGPIGAVLTPLMRPEPEAAELSQATSLCGACDDICPVRIPLHDLLLSLRRDRAAGGTVSRLERVAFRAWSLVWSVPVLYRLSGRLGRLSLLPLTRRGVVRRGPGPLSRWTAGRDLAAPARRPFHRRGR